MPSAPRIGDSIESVCAALKPVHHISYLLDGCQLHSFVAHYATLAYVFSASFKLRFYQHHKLSSPPLLERFWKRRGKHRGKNQSRGDERNVHRNEIGRDADGFPRQIASVAFFQQPDANILAKLEVHLTVAGIDRDHLRSAVLQKTIGESASRCAYVKTYCSSD